MIALFAITVLAKPVLITRYCTVAAPFAIVLIAVAAAKGSWLPRATFVVVTAGAILCSVSYHDPGSSWPDLGGAFRQAGQHWRHGDGVVLSNGIDPTLTSSPLPIYYSERYLPPGKRTLVSPSGSILSSLIRHKRRLWLVSTGPLSPGTADHKLNAVGYRVARHSRFAGNEPVQSELIVPSAVASGR